MKYIIEFSKTGTICYISHLDLLKVFKRAFKRAGIDIAYSQGFNPHPKMGFAQPLSLGYWGLEEYVEFETVNKDDPSSQEDSEKMISALSDIMPEGLKLLRIIEAPWLKKTLAAENVAAEYVIEIPFQTKATGKELCKDFLSQEKIMVLKKQKKKPEPVLIDIKNKIRNLDVQNTGDTLFINALLDSGSESNLSPELLISSFAEYFGIEIPRSDMNVARTKLFFKESIEKLIHA